MSTKRRVNSGRSCCVPGCSNRESKNPGLKFYSFPNREWENKRKTKWIIAVRRGEIDGKPWTPTKNTRICSSHFVNNEKSNDPRKQAYIPTIFHWKKIPLAPAFLDATTQAEYHSYEDEQSETLLYCWQDSNKNEASTQTYITISNSCDQEKKIVVEG